MSEVATKKEVKALQREMKDSFDDLTTIIRDFMQHVDERFTVVDGRLSGIEEEISQIKGEIVELKESHNRLLNTIDGFVGRIDKYEAELAARDNQFEKLLVWARKVSEKTGIPLENL